MQGEEGEGVRAETVADRPDTVGCYTPVHIHCTHTRLQLRSQACEPYPSAMRKGSHCHEYLMAMCKPDGGRANKVGHARREPGAARSRLAGLRGGTTSWAVEV